MKNKLWQQTSETKSQLEEIVEAFTVGNDVSFDLQLAKYDVLGSLAHIYMLQSVGLITKQDYDAMKLGLEEIQLLIEQGDFEIYDGVEDIHSQIELLLTQKIGDIGKKIHTGRSRNDQVLLDIKLFIKNELQEITSSIEKLFHTLITLSEEHKAQLLPGYLLHLAYGLVLMLNHLLMIWN